VEGWDRYVEVLRRSALISLAVVEEMEALR
jgi:hypothetical protein